MNLRIIGGTDYAPPRHVAQQPAAAGQPVSGKSTASGTSTNRTLRDRRRDGWRAADAAATYWLARIKFEDAIEVGRRYGILDACHHPERTTEQRWQLLENHRAALADQLLTPAPDSAAVSWKRALLASRKSNFIVDESGKKRVERAIVDDLAFLRAHPVRRSRSGASPSPAD